MSRRIALFVLLGLAAFGCQSRQDRFLGRLPEDQPGAQDLPRCLDADGDGHGLYCPAGPDCDDLDPSITSDCRVACGVQPVAGCACDDEAPAVECHSPVPHLNDHGRLVCDVGLQSCVDGVWSECVYDGQFAYDNPQARSVGSGPAPCGNCDPDCYMTGGDVEAGDVTADNSDGVAYGCIDAVCGLILAGGGVGGDGSVRYAYIALEPSHGSVTKIRMTDGVEVARYFVGFPAENNNRPSRTAIDSVGDAYVANRGNVSVSGGSGFMGKASDLRGSVTKIAGAENRCIDRNLNGQIDTSHTSAELPAGTDECVLWNVPIGIANGSIPRAMAVDRGDEAEPEGYPWVGTSVDADNLANLGGRAYKLDPVDGSTILSTALPINAYGAMADGQEDQKIWFTSYLTGGLASVDVTTGAVAGPFYPNMPDGHASSAYAITTDGRRIWRAGGPQEYVRSYDPTTGEHCLVDLPATKVASKRTQTKGIAVRLNADGSKEVWVTEAISQGRLWHFDADTACANAATKGVYCSNWGIRQCNATVTETRNENWYPPAGIGVVDLGPGNNTPLGLGLDFDNRIWAVNNITNNIAVYDPDDGSMIQYPDGPAIAGTYTYSDFTGYQRAVFTLTRGYLSQDYGSDAPVCPLGQHVTWTDLNWVAVAPPGSRIAFEAQTSGDPGGLSSATRVPLGEYPTTDPPIYVNDALVAAGVFQHHRYLRINVWLISDDGATSPVLQSFSQQWVCIDDA